MTAPTPPTEEPRDPPTWEELAGQFASQRDEARAEVAELRSDLNQATAVVEAAVQWKRMVAVGTLEDEGDALLLLDAAIDAYRRAAPTGGVEG